MGDLDLVYNIPGTKEFLHGGMFKKYVPLLDEVVVMEGVAHFLNQEKSDEINQHILEFIKKFWFFPPSSVVFGSRIKDFVEEKERIVCLFFSPLTIHSRLNSKSFMLCFMH